MKLKRLFFAGPLWKGSTSVSRMNGLKNLGLDVVKLDSTPWIGRGPKVFRSLNQRFYFAKSVRAMNATLLRSVIDNSPDVVWVDKGNWIYPGVLKRLQKYVRFIVHYNTDDTFRRWSYLWLHRLGLKYYDLYLTTNRFNVKEISKHYNIPALRVGMGYDKDFYYNPFLNLPRSYNSDIVFVGHWQEYSERCINALRDSGLNIKVWGHNWWKAKTKELRKSRYLPYADYVSVTSKAKIALCFLSKSNRNESTGRSFEIPAIGTFMLAERTPEHGYLYGDSQSAGLFSNMDELVSKAHYYLEHDKERESIALAGYNRCQALGLSWSEHIKREWPIVERILLNKGGGLYFEDDQPLWEGFRNGEPFSIKAQGGHKAYVSKN